MITTGGMRDEIRNYCEAVQNCCVCPLFTFTEHCYEDTASPVEIKRNYDFIMSLKNEED